jgi:hypothetical protein
MTLPLFARAQLRQLRVCGSEPLLFGIPAIEELKLHTFQYRVNVLLAVNSVL